MKPGDSVRVKETARFVLPDSTLVPSRYCGAKGEIIKHAYPGSDYDWIVNLWPGGGTPFYKSEIESDV